MGMQGTSTYIVKTILNMFINKYMFANLYQVDHFDLFILQTAPHAEKVWAPLV